MARKDILDQDVSKGDFVIYTSLTVGLRVGLVVEEDADGWNGNTYTYIHKKIKTVTLDYRDSNRIMQATSTPALNMVVRTDMVPEDKKELLRQRARELGYDA